MLIRSVRSCLSLSTMDRLKRLWVFHRCHNAGDRSILGRSEILYDVLINPLKRTDWLPSLIENALTNQLPVRRVCVIWVVIALHRLSYGGHWLTYLAQIMTAAGDNASLVVGRRRSRAAVEE